MDKTILITGTGGNVGQGILRNIRSLNLPIRIIGCNIKSFSPGNHLCDYNYKVPYAYDDDYITEINHIVKKELIDLVIPSTDFEAFYLAKHIDNIQTTVAVSEYLTTEIYLDKYKSFLHHKKNDIPFAETCLPSEYNDQYQETIVKLKQGRGSRGIYVNPNNVKNFSDKDYLVQEFIRGKEITTAFYVNKSGVLHGYITMERSLENGTTNECMVTTQYDQSLEIILQKIISHSDIKGSANLQSIVNMDGSIVPFELNCRISGTNSIRSNFGFEDVKYTVQEYLYGIEPDKVQIRKGVATRILMDVVYSDVSDIESCVNNNSYKIF